MSGIWLSGTMSENLGIFKLQNGIESTNLHFTDVGLSPNCNVGRDEKAKSVVVVRSKPSQTAIYERQIPFEQKGTLIVMNE